MSAIVKNQAFAALLFLSTRVLDTPIQINAERAKLPERLPVVLSVNEVRSLLLAIPPGVNRLMAGLLYGAGRRSGGTAGPAPASRPISLIAGQ